MPVADYASLVQAFGEKGYEVIRSKTMSDE